LISFDLDGTLVRVPTLRVLARRLGIEKELDSYDHLMHRGRISKAVCLKEQFALFGGYKTNQLLRLVSEVPRIGWIRRTVENFKSRGLKVIVLSDNLTFLSRFFLQYGFETTLGSTGVLRGGTFTGKATIADDKSSPLRKFCRARGLSLSECIHVGDWDNDIPVFEAVGLSLALNPKNRKVTDNADLMVRTDSLLDVYRKIRPFLDAEGREA
jgi:phosphoserine phosphatase